MRESSTQPPQTRREFLKRATLGLAAAATATLAAGKLAAAGTNKTGPVPGSGSIFEPRRQDLLRYWREKLGRLRLR